MFRTMAVLSALALLGCTVELDKASENPADESDDTDSEDTEVADPEGDEDLEPQETLNDLPDDPEADEGEGDGEEVELPDDEETTASDEDAGTPDDGGDERPTDPEATDGCDGFDADGDGFVDEDCLDDCPDPDDSVSLSLGIERGDVVIETDEEGAVVEITNDGDVGLDIDEPTLHTSEVTQAALLAPETFPGDVRLEPGATLFLYYASYTTDNAHTMPYLGEPGWWCFESGQSTFADAPFDWYGEEAPPVLVDRVSPTADEDGDGVADIEDWAGSYGVQAQYAIWDWQASHVVLTVGKRVDVDGDEIEVVLTARNVGAEAGEGTVRDTIPLGWSVTAELPAPDDVTTDSSGATVLSWSVSLDGVVAPTSEDGTVGLDAETLTYRLRRDIAVDAPRVVLGRASVDYHDGEGWQSSFSVEAVAENYDYDGDGTVACGRD